MSQDAFGNDFCDGERARLRAALGAEVLMHSSIERFLEILAGQVGYDPDNPDAPLHQQSVEVAQEVISDLLADYSDREDAARTLLRAKHMLSHNFKEPKVGAHVIRFSDLALQVAFARFSDTFSACGNDGILARKFVLELEKKLHSLGERYPDNISIQFELARINMSLGGFYRFPDNLEKAEFILEDLYRKYPNQADIGFFLASTIFMAGRANEAHELFVDILDRYYHDEMDPDSVPENFASHVMQKIQQINMNQPPKSAYSDLALVAEA